MASIKITDADAVYLNPLYELVKDLFQKDGWTIEDHSGYFTVTKGNQTLQVCPSVRL